MDAIGSDDLQFTLRIDLAFPFIILEIVRIDLSLPENVNISSLVVASSLSPVVVSCPSAV